MRNPFPTTFTRNKSQISQDLTLMIQLYIAIITFSSDHTFSAADLFQQFANGLCSIENLKRTGYRLSLIHIYAVYPNPERFEIALLLAGCLPQPLLTPPRRSARNTSETVSLALPSLSDSYMHPPLYRFCVFIIFYTHEFVNRLAMTCHFCPLRSYFYS